MIYKNNYTKPNNKKLINNDLDVINQNVFILIKQLNKINKHLSRIDYDIGKIKRQMINEIDNETEKEM